MCLQYSYFRIGAPLFIQKENLLLGASQTQTQGSHCQNGSWGSTLALHQPPKSPLHQVTDSFNAPYSTIMLGDPAPPTNLDFVFMDGFCHSAQHSSHHGLDIRVVYTLLATEGDVTRGLAGRVFISQLRQVWPDDLTLLCYQKLEQK